MVQNPLLDACKRCMDCLRDLEAWRLIGSQRHSFITVEVTHALDFFHSVWLHCLPGVCVVDDRFSSLLGLASGEQVENEGVICLCNITFVICCNMFLPWHNEEGFSMGKAGG